MGYCAVPSVDLTSRWSGGVLWLTLQPTCVLAVFPSMSSITQKKETHSDATTNGGVEPNPSAQ